MGKLSLDKKKQWKKSGILLCVVLVFILLTAGFLWGESPAKAQALDKEEPSLVSRVLVTGEGNPINDHRKEEIEKEQQEIQKKREQKKEELANEETKGSAQDTSPKGTAADGGSSGIGGEPGGPDDPEQKPPDGNEGNEPEDPIPGGDDPSKLPVIYSTLRNGDSWNGTKRSFAVYADDYQGRHIKRGNFNVYANGEKLYSSGDQYEANYRMKLLEGTNHVSITVTDTYGVSATREYTFTGYPKAQPDKKGTVYVTLDMRTIGAGYAFTNYPVDLYAGENIADVVVRALEENGYSVGYTGTLEYGFYLMSIEKPGLLKLKQNCVVPPPILAKLEEINADEMSYNTDDRILHKEIYSGSGFIYLHNGTYYGDLGTSDMAAKSEDEITIGFTVYNGLEYNGEWFWGSW